MKINISNVIKGFCAIFLLGILAVSCRQDPIFHVISTETAPIPPRIPGAPTNMVVFQRWYQDPIDPADPDFDPDAVREPKLITLLFVASGKLHWYGSPDPANESPRWDRDYGIPRPGEKVIALAVTEKYLYALCLNSSSLRATLRYTTQTLNDTWHEVTGVSEFPLIQSIYSTYSDGDDEEGQLFAGARRGNTYALLYLDDTIPDNQILRLLIEKKEKTDKTIEMLSGAVCRDGVYYLCTRGSGIFKVKKDQLGTGPVSNSAVIQLKNIIEVETQIEVMVDPEDPPDPGDPPDPVDPEIKIETIPKIVERNNTILFMGMIKLNDKSIIAIGRNDGILYEILTDDNIEELFAHDNDDDEKELYKSIITEKNGAFSQIFYDNTRSARTGGYATGAFTLWEDPLNSETKLLVAGRQGTLFSTSYNNGYIEFNLKSDGSFDKENPSRGMLTVNNSDRYSTSLEKQPINHLFQVPKEVDIRRIFFASTQTGGLWSYRDRSSNGGWQWNAEN
jgi:hypothetical protein